MKKIKSAFLVLFAISLLTQTSVFCACDKVKKACSISDLNKLSQISKEQNPSQNFLQPKRPFDKLGVKESIKSWLKSLK